MKPEAVLNTCNTRADNVMWFKVEFRCQSKDTGITTLCGQEGPVSRAPESRPGESVLSVNFYRATNASAVLALYLSDVRPDVCPCLCSSKVGLLSKRMNKYIWVSAWELPCVIVLDISKNNGNSL